MQSVLIPYDDLSKKGVTYSKVQLWRLEKTGAFPKRVRISSARHAWIEAEIDAWIAKKISERVVFKGLSAHTAESVKER